MCGFGICSVIFVLSEPASIAFRKQIHAIHGWFYIFGQAFRLQRFCRWNCSLEKYRQL